MLLRGECQSPVVLPQRMTRYALYTRLAGSQRRSGRVRKISPPPGFDLRKVEPLASGSTDKAILARQMVV